MSRPLSDLIPLYAQKKLRRANPSTAKKFGYALGYFEEFLTHLPTTADLTDDTVAEFQDWILDGGSISADTAHGYVKKLVALWRFAWLMREEAEPGILVAAPMIEVERPPEHIPVGWTALELPRLFEALRAQTGWVGGVPAAKWWVALHLLIWDSMSRIYPVLALPWSQVNLDSRYAWFAASTMKFKKRPKGFSLGLPTVEALREIQLPKRERVLPWPLTYNMLWDRYRAILVEAGLPADRQHMFHCLRRTASSMFGDKTSDADAAGVGAQ